jgi:hypothetical protein
MSRGFCSNLHLERAFGYRFTKCLPCFILRFNFHGHIQRGFSFSRSFTSYVSAPRLVRRVWHSMDDCHMAVLASPLRWTLHALLNGSTLRAPFNIVVSNVENVLGVTSGRYDKQLVCIRNAFFSGHR